LYTLETCSVLVPVEFSVSLVYNFFMSYVFVSEGPMEDEACVSMGYPHKS